MQQIKLKRGVGTREKLYQGSLNVLYVAAMVSIYVTRQMMIFAAWNVKTLYYVGLPSLSCQLVSHLLKNYLQLMSAFMLEILMINRDLYLYLWIRLNCSEINLKFM